MELLITGGTGFIGRQLCRSLNDQGHTITILTRNPGKGAQILGEGIDFITDLDSLTPADHFDAIINLAGEPIFGGRWTAKRKQAIRDSRIGTTAKLVSFIARCEHKPELLISGSAIGYYGDQGDQMLDESAPGHPEFAHELCRDWEAEAAKAREQGVRLCIVRTGLVVGKGGGFLQPMLLPFRLGLGGRLGSGEQWLSWIHMDDYLAMIWRLLEDASLEGVFNATAPNPVTNREFTEILARVLHRPALLPVPAWVLKLLLGEMSGLLLGGQRVLPARFLEAGFRFQHTELEPALRDVITG